MLKVMCFVLVASRFFPLSLRFTSTTRLVQLHHGSRTAVVWAEGRGGWWESEFLNDRLVHSGASSLCCSRFLSISASVWEKDACRGGFSWHCGGICRGGCAAPEQTTPWEWACQVRQHQDRRSDRHVEESVALLLSFPPSPPTTPSSRPHTTPGTHTVAIPRKLPAALWSVRLRVKFSVCSMFKAWLVARLKWQHF